MNAINNNNNTLNSNQNNIVSALSESPKAADQEDLLDIKNFTEGIIDYVKYADTPLSIAINGKWGSGKTSIMNEIKDKLCDGDDKEFYGICINTWQFSLLDSTESSQAVVRILQSMVNQITALKPDYDRRDQIAKLIGSIAKVSTNLKSVYDVAGNPLFGVGKSTIGTVAKASTLFKDLFSNKSHSISDDKAALITQLSFEIQKLVDEVLNRPQKVHNIHVQQYVPFDPFNPSDWTDNHCHFGTRFVWAIFLIICNFFTMIGFAIYNAVLIVFNIINIFLSRTWFVLKDFLLNYCCHVLKMSSAVVFNQKMPTKNNRKGFIFFIDDLDRIDSKLALQIIESLAGVFSFKNCIFIVAADRNTLLDAVRSKFENQKSDIKHNDVQHVLYLNRFIHVSIDMPNDIYTFNKLLKNYLQDISFFTASELENEHLLNSLDKVVRKTVGGNPRAIKQLINSLSFFNLIKNTSWNKGILRLIDNTISKEMIFIMLCVKMFYPFIFDQMIINPYFKDWDFNFISDFETDKDNENKVNVEFNEEFFKNKSIKKENFLQQARMKDKNTPSWEYEMSRFCSQNKYDFTKVKEVFRVIDKDLSKYIKDNKITIAEKDVYKVIFARIFVLFFNKAILLNDYDDNEYNDYLVKLIKGDASVWRATLI